ncbi:hypothetical protein [Nakamurella aerolata]|uniref:Uncharacterized protein n=1 Tax=Nakamurella aerolata TaxID=1656892 RepID=A0A849A7G4_9ACTN|nr:hypothetical protein [Nakamurella aerolata]NNG34440.1 hypothetical protein [Nakamurella aerolata]
MARALVHRPDTAWVTLISGGTEIVCATRAQMADDDQLLLLADLSCKDRHRGGS